MYPRNTHVQADYKSLISYYLREGFYQHAADEATEQIQRRGNDTYLLYWEGELHAHVCRTLLNRKLSAHLAAAAGLQRQVASWSSTVFRGILCYEQLGA